MGRYRWLVVLALGMGMAVAACGSGGGPVDQDGQPVSTETPRSERAEREATIMEQQAQQVAGQTAQDEPVPDTPIESAAGEVEDEAAASGVIDFGHREGLPFARNVVGDPDAPVVIVEYSDFQ